MKSLAVIFCVLLVVAAATTDLKKKAAKKVKLQDQKGSGMLKHIAKLLKQVDHESEEGHKKFTVYVANCHKKGKMHKKTIGKLKIALAKAQSAITSNQGDYKKIQATVIPAFEKEAKELEGKKDKLQKDMEEGDANRKETYAKYVKKRKHYAKHLAFIRKLYLFIMGSKVEKRRTVLMQAKTKEVMAHASSIANAKAQAMMEEAASMLATGHLDGLYKLLDNLRGEVQRDMRASKRKELRSANNWVLKHANLRSKQLHFHKQQLRASLNASKAEMKAAKLDWDTEMKQRKSDTSSLNLEHHTRDAKLLKLRCRRTVMYYSRKFIDWKDEKIALEKVEGKIKAFYK